MKKEIFEEGESQMGYPKKGIARLWELIIRDFWNFFRANLILLISACPGMVLIMWGTWGHSLTVALIGGIVLGLLGTPFICCLFDTLLRSLRDEAGFWSLQYKRALKQNWKDALLPGIIFGVLLAVWIFEMNVLIEQENISGLTLIVMLEFIFFLMGIFNYVFSQITLVSVSASKLYANSVRLFIGAFPNSVAAAIVQLVYWGCFWMFLPKSVPFLMISGFWLPNLFVLMILVKPLRKYLHLESIMA